MARLVDPDLAGAAGQRVEGRIELNAGEAEHHADAVRGLARTGGANPTWDAASLTCSNVYCHSGKAQNWNSTQLICGGCHGIPPSDAAHLPSFQLTDCHNCHRTVDATGALKPGTHINGVVDGP